MVEGYGKLRLKDPNSGNEFSFGTITGIQESFQKSGSTFPLVAMSAENTIVIDTKTAKVISVSFLRKQPENVNDSSSDTTRWSNATWFDTISKCVNRWQCRTDGYRLTYVPTADNPYVAPIDENGYLRNFTARFVSGSPTKLKGSFEFHVGTMYVGSQMPSNNEESRAQKDFQIALYDKKGSTPPYILLGEKVNCVESYTIHGGPEAPFEYVTMKIPKKELKQVAPGLFEGEDAGIIPGMNRLTISAIGTSTMTVTKVKLSNDSYTITAYCEAERIRGYTLTSGGQLTPASWINKILSGGEYGGLRFSGSTLVANYDTALSNLVGEIEFKKGTNVWYILQVCAMCVRARVFFADNKAYVIDYCKGSSTYPRYETKIDLHPSSGNAMYSGATLGNVDLGDEGVDTIANSVSISCTTPQMKDGAYVTDEYGNTVFTAFNYYTYSDGNSVNTFKERAANTMYLSELKQNDPNNMPETKPDDSEGEGSGTEGEEEEKKEVKLYFQAEYFAKHLIAYRSEPQQTVEFTLKEMRSVNNVPTWKPYFGPASTAGQIYDDVNDVDVTNLSAVDKSTPVYQKLALSTYSRSYPEGKSTYTWGVLSTIDLSSNTSQITTSLGNVK
jgi:hypothetical protein